jgi:hypothetical protein
VHDADLARAPGQPPLVLVEEVRGAEGVVAADGDQGLDVEREEPLVDAPQALGLLGIVEIVERADVLAWVGAAGADGDAARVAEAAQIAVGDEVVVLVGDERSRGGVVRLERGGCRPRRGRSGGRRRRRRR